MSPDALIGHDIINGNCQTHHMTYWLATRSVRSSEMDAEHMERSDIVLQYVDIPAPHIFLNDKYRTEFICSDKW